MKRKGLFLFFVVLFIVGIVILLCNNNKETVSTNINNSDFEESLYAKYAVLMDGDSGLILYGKSANVMVPMASTTKIMTLIIALEVGIPEISIMSPDASRQPKVHLGVPSDSKFYTKDLLYSMMLESHNDSAYCIAENIGAKICGKEFDVQQERTGYLKAFLKKMNEKAKEIGCCNTLFLSPNGLDLEMDGNKHHSTAEDMARILRYCIYESPEKEQFLQITQTLTYSFSDVSGQMHFRCFNHNQLLHTMNGAISGKTGFTGNAGYCYVGAVEIGEKKFIVSLLACGWPNNRTYKWHDVRTLIQYGDANYERVDVGAHEPIEKEIIVLNAKRHNIDDNLTIKVKNKKTHSFLLKNKNESIEITDNLKEKIKAPIKKGDKVGSLIYKYQGKIIAFANFESPKNVDKIDFFWCWKKLLSNILI